MSEMKPCVAIVEFRLNTPGTEDGIIIKAGDKFLYDGIKAKVRTVEDIEKTVSAPMLKSTLGEWYRVIKPKSLQNPNEKTQKSKDMPVSSEEKIVEQSAIGGDGEPQNLNEMVEDYEKKTAKGSVILNDDADIVKEVTKVEGTEGNKPGVTAENQDTGKKKVVASEERLAKKTNYNKSKIESSEPKEQKREIISDGEGEVVKKTKVPAIKDTEVKDTQTERKRNKDLIAQDGDVALETDYEEDKSSDVGSSTQTKTTKTKKASSKKGSSTKSSRKSGKRPKTGVQNIESQEAKVVGKTRRDENIKETSDGFVVKTTVGASDEIEVPEATTSANDQIVVGEAKVGKAGQRHTEASEDDIDIGDILDDI